MVEGSEAAGEPTAEEGPETRDAPRPSEDRAPLERIRLRVLVGPDAGRVHVSTSGEVVVGSHPSADLVLSDPTVSRFHCRFTIEPGGARLRDLGSRNGTLLQGISIVEAVLTAGATLTLGDSQLRFERDGAPFAPALSPRERFGLLVGRSQPMRSAFALLERAAECDSTVLLTGETGTGKEAAAESIHRASARRDGPFVVVDCAAVPGELLESELYGHERGAFTGATSARRGAFESARGGTVFLDEIGELGPELQTRLLRVLERREVKRLGASDFLPVDARVIAATNRELHGEVNARRFRSDVYYRLAVLVVRLPPLRERLQDLPLLVDELLAKLPPAQRELASWLRSSELVADLTRHPWPGNVRELRNHLERCLALHERVPVVGAPSAEAPGEPPVGSDRPLKAARDSWVQDFERRYLEDLLQRHQGNVAAAARAAGVARAYLYRLLWRHGLR